MRVDLGVQEEKPEASQEATVIIQGWNDDGLDRSDRTEVGDMRFNSEYILKVDKIAKVWGYKQRN